MQSIAAESGPFFRDALRAFVHKIDPVYVLNEHPDKLFFFLPRKARLLSNSGYAKVKVIIKVFKSLRDRTRVQEN